MYMLRKRVFAVLFVVVLLAFSAVNAWHTFPALRETVSEGIALLLARELRPAELVSQVEDQTVENLWNRMSFIEGYSYVQSLLDKREFNNFQFVKDENGLLHYGSFFREDDTDELEYALRIRRLRDYAEQYGTKVLFVVPPSKYMERYTVLRKEVGINDPSSLVDSLIFYVNRLGVESLNLQDHLPDEDITYQETFFKTDHHWTIPAAFEASRVIVQTIRERFGEDLDPEGFYTDIGSYRRAVYKDSMFGSMGRRTGAHFVGLEDFEALWPLFTVHYTRESMRSDGEMDKYEGVTEETLMKPDILLRNDSIYSDSNYSLYLDALRDYDHIVNLDNPDGPSAIFIRDSYMSPVIVFMAPMFGEIHAIRNLVDPETLDIEEFVRENRADYIIVEVYPFNITQEAAFAFFEE